MRKNNEVFVPFSLFLVSVAIAVLWCQLLAAFRSSLAGKEGNPTSWYAKFYYLDFAIVGNFFFFVATEFRFKIGKLN